MSSFLCVGFELDGLLLACMPAGVGSVDHVGEHHSLTVAVDKMLVKRKRPPTASTLSRKPHAALRRLYF